MLHTFLFIRIYSIRILKIKSGKKLRMSEEYAYLEFVLTKFKVYFFKNIHVIISFLFLCNYIYIEICLYFIKLKLLRWY